MWNLLEKLGKIKNTHIALHGGKKKASYQPIKTNNKNVLLFSREKNGKKVYFLANLSKNQQSIQNILKEVFTDLLTSKKVEFKSDLISLTPWQFYVLE